MRSKAPLMLERWRDRDWWTHLRSVGVSSAADVSASLIFGDAPIFGDDAITIFLESSNSSFTIQKN